MAFRWLRILFFLVFPLPVVAETVPLDSLFPLPPAMAEIYGNAVVHHNNKPGLETEKYLVRGAGRYDPKRGIIPAAHRAHFIAKGTVSESELAPALARFVLSDFYSRVLSLRQRSRHEKRMKLAEFLPVTKELFVERGTGKLLSGRSGLEWFDAWWTIRMGLPRTHDPSHHLVIICLKYDHDGKKDSLGHFCFGLRKRGGDAERDTVFDFRAPWYEDRPPTLMEGMNSGNKLETLTGHTVNFYDWLYTQASYRHCLVEMTFLPVSREQVTVLRYFDEKISPHDAGEFKGLRKNCASLGMAFYDRLGSVSEPVSLGKGLADIPSATAARIVEEAGGGFPFYELGNNTHERGREPTAKSKIHRAKPSRAGSRSFRELRGVKGIN